MANPTSNFGWQMPTPTDLVTDLPADFEVFGQAVDTSLADLQGGTTGQILSKASNTNMDFAWITNDVGDITAVNVTAPITGGGSSGAVTIGVDAASTSAAGVVQLSDSTSTTSSVLASTPTATKAAYDLADAAIAKSTLTTAGDVLYRNATVPVRLGIGTAGQVLTVNSGATAPEWATPASPSYTGVAVYIAGTTVALTANVQKILNFANESFDTNSFHDNSVNNTRITIPTGKSGKYQIDVYWRLTVNVNYANINLLKNGSAITDGIEAGLIAADSNLASNSFAIPGTVTLNLTEGDYIEMAVQSSTTSSPAVYARLSATFLGA